MFQSEMSREDAPLVFLYVFLSTTALIMLIYFISLLIYHCVFWPKILAKIKADKPVQTAKQEQILQKLVTGRDRNPEEDKTQSERTETPNIERTQSHDDVFAAARTVVSENASLVGDKTPHSARSVQTCAATVTAAAVGSAELLETAKECRPGKARKWYEDDMMTTGMEMPQQPTRTSEASKDLKRRGKGKRADDLRTGRDTDFLQTGRERKEGGKTRRKLRFAPQHDDTRTCIEKAPLLSQSYEGKSDEQQQPKRTSEDLRRRRKGGVGAAAKAKNSPLKEQQPRSVYAYEVDSKSKDKEEKKEKEKKQPKTTVTTGATKSTDNSRDRAEGRLLDLCKTQED